MSDEYTRQSDVVAFKERRDAVRRAREHVLAEIARERARQIETLGWSLAHDDEHRDGALAVAAASYALPNMCRPRSAEASRRDLVKAGALIVAEIERLDRAAPPPGGPAMSGVERDSSNTSNPTAESQRDAVLRLDVGAVEYTRDALGAWSITASPRLLDLERGVGPLLAAALDALVAARAAVEEQRQWKETLLEKARGRHPEGATLLDFYAVWLEQEQAKNAQLSAELAVAQQDAARWRKRFPMQEGPPLPWPIAEVIYAGYTALYNNDQSLERIAERGGFGWSEVGLMWRNGMRVFAARAAMQSAADALLAHHGEPPAERSHPPQPAAEPPHA